MIALVRQNILLVFIVHKYSSIEFTRGLDMAFFCLSIHASIVSNGTGTIFSLVWQYMYMWMNVYMVYGHWLTDFCSFEKTIFCFKIGKNAG